MENRDRIKAKVALGLPLTHRERSTYLLYIATKEEVEKFLEAEANNE